MRRPKMPGGGYELLRAMQVSALHVWPPRRRSAARTRAGLPREGDNWRGHSLVPQAFAQSAISCDTDEGGETQVLMRQLHEFDPPLAALQLVAEAR